MSDEYEIKLPKLGESIVSATIVAIYKKEKDFIKKDETLLEVATDKVNSEIPSPVEGKISKILVRLDQTVQVGDTIAIVLTETQPKELREIKPQEDKTIEDTRSFFSPAVLRFAKENNLSLEDLEQIKGTGEGKRVTKKDVENFILSKSQKQSYVDLSYIRKAIAHAMTKSLEVPTAYLVDEIDVTDLIKLIETKKRDFFKKYSSKLTITTFFARAIALAAFKYPMVNSTFLNDKIIIKDEINLGIAVNVDGDVIVPIIKNIQDLNIVDIAKNLNSLILKTKIHELAQKDIENGTITLSNFGMAQVKIGFPIIKYPEACIIGIGAIKKNLKVLDNDQTQIRSIINLSLGFDHRIFDGMYACMFINEIKKYIEHEFDRSF